ncbi:CTK2 [Candida oxycetoniae]|uniref:CTK2 n=1 Tax=Candida oxycetoniae TaxID=497107 RepID=A0AAI9T1Z2_9ASCO|nr:CTK2 [Candida oxycetoniae]KAI3407055.2 CTK2 [Candida oxycetoniae]
MSKESSPSHNDSGGSSSLTPTQNNHHIPSITQISRPFFTSRELSYLHNQTIPTSLKLQYGSTKTQVFQFLSQAVKILKFPIRVLATTMNYYQRFYLFNKFDVNGVSLANSSSPNQFDGDPYTIAITCLFLASKIEDCVKKLKEIQQVCNKLRDIDETKSIGSGGGIQYIDYQRKYILSTEFKLLQIIKFDFNYGNNPSFRINVDDIIIQFCKQMDINYKISILSWLVNCDIIQTPLSLVVPPHCIALAIIIISLNLNPKEMSLSHKAMANLDKEEETLKVKKILDSIDCSDFNCPEVLVNEAIIYILDYYTHQYANSTLSKYLPETDSKTGKNQTFKIMDLKQRFNDVELLNEASCTTELNTSDEYFENWDYNIALKGSARFMLGHKRRRFNTERKQLRQQQQQQQQQQQRQQKA